MNEIIVVNKEKNYTSRDVVNILCKKFKTKKIGHTGTLDPIATGVLVVCIGKSLKIVDNIVSYDKEYIARVILGINTDTLDITGKILNEETTNIKKEDLISVLNSFLGTSTQEVPKYSAVKVNGKKLYEYARNNIEIELPKKEITIYNIELLSDIELVNNHQEFTFKVKVSKGTYIRSLIRDIGIKLNTYATMSDLVRTKQGKFNIENSYTLKEIEEDNYKSLDIKDVLDIEKTIIKEPLLTKIKNGAIVNKFFKTDKTLVLDENNNEIGIYITYDKDNTKAKPDKIF